jgi:hypothetical protein
MAMNYHSRAAYKGARKRYKGEEELIAAGYTNVMPYGFDGRFGKWFEAVDPRGDKCVILRQAANCWHWFHSTLRATASGMSAATANEGGLGDAIDHTNMRAYVYLLKEVPGPFATKHAGLYEACSQVMN